MALAYSLHVVGILLVEFLSMPAQVSSLLVPVNPTSLMLQLDYSDVIRYAICQQIMVMNEAHGTTSGNSASAEGMIQSDNDMCSEASNDLAIY